MLEHWQPKYKGMNWTHKNAPFVNTNDLCVDFIQGLWCVISSKSINTFIVAFVSSTAVCLLPLSLFHSNTMTTSGHMVHPDEAPSN